MLRQSIAQCTRQMRLPLFSSSNFQNFQNFTLCFCLILTQNFEQNYLILSHVETVDSTMYQTNETPFVFLSLCLNNYKSATNLNWLPVGSSGTHQWVNFANFPHKTKTRIDFIPIQYDFHNFVHIHNGLILGRKRSYKYWL